MKVGGLSATSGAILFSTSSTVLAQSTGFTWNATGAAGEGLAIAAGTATTAVAALSSSVTLNNAAVAFVPYDFTVVDTASAAGMLPWRIRGGAAGTTTLFSLDKSGNITFNGVITSTTQPLYIQPTAAGTIQLYTTGAVRIGTASDASLSYISTGLIGVGTGAGGSFAGRIKLTSTITAAVAVGSLNASPTIGEVQTVNDALAVTVKGATVAAGGSAVCQVMWNSSAWVGI